MKIRLLEHQSGNHFSQSILLSEQHYMECQIQYPNSPFICKLTQIRPNYICSFSPTPNVRSYRTPSSLFTCYNSADKPVPTTTKTSKPKAYTVKFQTLSSCKLGISRYPDFIYNAQGGTGSGKGSPSPEDDDIIHVDFDLDTLFIPPLTTATTSFLGLPLPPFLRIDIAPEVLRGTISQDTGKVELEFIAKFWFSVGQLYKAPPLLVGTVLTSGESKGTMRSGRGKKLDEEGKCQLVGVATVQPINDFLMNSFLGLPTECLAELNAIISLSVV